jgi:hypothetical protein
LIPPYSHRLLYWRTAREYCYSFGIRAACGQ